MAAKKGNHNSMPSSHAANWFAATMVLFLFYRKSLWFMLPMALAVSFWRARHEQGPAGELAEQAAG